jgi:hypothetical protein
MMVSIVPLKLLAEANVESAHDEEQDHDSDKKQIHHRIRVSFSSSAAGVLPLGCACFACHYGRHQVFELIKMQKERIKFS